MKPENSPGKDAPDVANGVVTPVLLEYNWNTLYERLTTLNARGRSLRQIAKDEFDDRVSHAVIQRCLQGIEPMRNDVRVAMGLPKLTLIPQRRDPKGRYRKAT